MSFICSAEGRRTRMRIETILATYLLWTLMTNAVFGQEEFDSIVREGGALRWALQQGGILVAFLITLWFYRRDLMRWAEEKKQDAEERKTESRERLAAKDMHIEVLVDLVKSNTQHSANLTQVVQSLAERRHST